MNRARLTQFLGWVPGCSHLLRWYAHQFEEGSVVRIRQGYAAGFLWKRHHRYVNGYWIGQYELPIQEALVRELKQGDVFFDVGANAGFFTLLAARIVGPSGRCFAFDPAPANIESITEQIALNRLGYCQAVSEALGDREGTVRFAFSEPGSPSGHLGIAGPGQQESEVAITTLDCAAERFGPPTFVKMDIEGAEASALRGAVRVLREHRPRWLIELHGETCARDSRAILLAAEYRLFGLDGQALDQAPLLPSHILARPV